MSKESKILREFSKENLQDERDSTAKNIREYRSRYFDAVKKKSEKSQSFYDLEKNIPEKEKELNELMNQLNDLKNKINDFSDSFLKKILNNQGIKNLQAELSIGKQSFEDLKNKIQELKEEKTKVNFELNEIYSLLDMKGAKIISENFHKRELEIWKNADYDFETLEKYFNEENLKDASLEDYIILLQRFPSNMLTHVTRQGIRDHTGHMFHSAGVGAYSKGFMEILEDGRLRSPLGVYLSQENKKQAIENFLHLDLYDSRERAMEYLNYKLNPRAMSDAGSYSDSNAIHFAAEEVADCYYGSEKFNEMFVCFPSAFIASQYYYNGNIISGGSGYWNDAWVWANEERGIDLDCGLVFIPKNAKVDKKTGSRYELDENQNPIVDDINIKILRNIININNSEIDEINKEFEEYNKKRSDFSGNLSKHLFEKNKQKIREILNIKDGDLLDVISENPYILKEIKNTHEIYLSHDDYEARLDSVIRSILEENGLYYKHATNTINSQDFWENYFKESKTKKPNKIIYYEEQNPTLALYNFRQKNHLNFNTIRDNTDKANMLSGNRIQREDKQAISGIDNFKLLALEVINEYFDRKS